MKQWLSTRRELIFLLGLLLVATGVLSPGLALAAGLMFGLSGAHPLRSESHRLARLLLQASVVLLGFGIHLREVLHAGRAGAGYTAGSIAAAMTLGLVLGRLCAVKPRTTFLIAAGTAICGGSAIAALAPVAEASEEEISVAMGSVFLLNAVALLLFPVLGAAMHFSQTQFGLWAALAIHDTSSVVGASARFGPQALAVGTAVKLVRALWIVPLTLLTASLVQRRGRAVPGRAGVARARTQWPWFIFLFCGASVLSSSVPGFAHLFGALNHLGRLGLAATLYLIGTGVSSAMLRRVGARPMVLAVLLWVVVGTVSAWAIHAGVIGI